MSKQKKDSKPHLAPGMFDFPEKKATRANIRKGKFTRVTRLSYDETK